MKLELLNSKGAVFSDVEIFKDADPITLVRYFSDYNNGTQLVKSLFGGYNVVSNLEEFHSKQLDGFLFVVNLRLGETRETLSQLITREYVLSASMPELVVESLYPSFGISVGNFVMDKCVVKELGE